MARMLCGEGCCGRVWLRENSPVVAVQHLPWDEVGPGAWGAGQGQHSAVRGEHRPRAGDLSLRPALLLPVSSWVDHFPVSVNQSLASSLSRS